MNHTKAVEITSIHEQRLATKRTSSPESHAFQAKRPNMTQENYFVDVGRNHSCHLCSNCKIFIQKPYQLECGHRICGACVNTEKNTIDCLQCGQLSGKEQVWLDGSFNKELEKLDVKCLECSWSGSFKLYQEHSEKEHGEAAKLTATTRTRMPSNEHSVDGTQPNSEVPPRPRIEQVLLAVTIGCFLQNEKERKNVSYDGTFTWTIPDITKKFGDAISGQQKSIYLPPFYSALEGYKMCLRIYLNGDADVQGTHLSLFLVMMRGEHDGELQWPFSGQITLTLLDQTKSNGSDDVTRELWSEHASGCFNHPGRILMNAGYGVKRFVCLKSLNQRWHLYVKNDAMKIRVKIDLWSPRPATLAASQIGDLPNDGEYDETYQDIHV